MSPISSVLSISARFGFHLDQPTDTMLQFEAAATAHQRLVEVATVLPGSAIAHARVPALHGIGERIWLRAEGLCEVTYDATVELTVDQGHTDKDISGLGAFGLHELPGETVEYLLDSRYCAAAQFREYVFTDFAGLSGGALILAMRDWVAGNIRYQPGSSWPWTTAADTLADGAGVCRDFVHVLISLARAAAIPARYVSCFAPDVKPQDFHAVAEVFLADPAAPGGGAWHMVDPTGMASHGHTARIGVGRDAGDVAFLTVFGSARFDFSEVQVSAALQPNTIDAGI